MGLFFGIVGLTNVCPALAQQGSARDTQEILQEATRYTVRVRYQVRTAFNGEHAGTGFGAGFLVDKQRGWILTNSHVARTSPGRLDVAFVDGGFQSAQRVYVDPHFDVAVISVPPENIPATATTSVLACDEGVPPGKPVAAFGHPYSLRFSATRGIVSAIRYRYPTERIQTDAAINPGNSGGPLIELSEGKVVGINYASLGAAQAAGLHFAVPIKHVCRMLDLMYEGKDPSPVEVPIAYAHVDQREELLVGRNGPGDWQALRPGDRITSVDGEKGLKNPSQLVTKLRGRTTAFALEVSRGNETETISIKPALMAPLVGQVGLTVSGMTLTSSWYADDAVVNPERNLVVSHVDSASEASAAQVRAGHLLVSLNGLSFSSLDKLFAYLSGQDKASRVTAILRAPSAEPVSHFVFYQATLALTDVQRLKAQ